MRFQITERVHFGYMREPGIYDDITDADALNLSSPRPGLQDGYGRRVDAVRTRMSDAATRSAASTGPARAVAGDTTQTEKENSQDEAKPAPQSIAAVPGGTQPNDPIGRPGDQPTDGFFCRDAKCAGKQPFTSAIARDTHERKKHGRVLA